VRSYYQGYTGHRPRLQHWHGTADTTLNFKNLAEDVKEWTNLLGLTETPTGTDTPKSGTTHELWKNSCGYTVYETFALSGVQHSVPFDGNAVAAYFGLDEARETDPETAACGGGMGGAAGAAGMGMAGGTALGGAGNGNSGGALGTSGATSAGGIAGSGGVHADSGGAPSGGAPSGGSESGAGRTGNAPGGAGGTAGAGAGNQAGRSAANGGMAVMAGQPGTGGSASPAGNATRAGTSGGAEPASGDSGATGCGCVVGGRTGERLPEAAALVLAALLFVRRRPRCVRSERDVRPS
jgi:hypothetical protein